GQAVFQGVFTSVAALFLYVRAVHVLGASQTSFFFVLVPVFGTLLASIVLDERVSAVQGAGIAAVAVAMMLATFRRRDRRRASLGRSETKQQLFVGRRIARHDGRGTMSETLSPHFTEIKVRRCNVDGFGH